MGPVFEFVVFEGQSGIELDTDGAGRFWCDLLPRDLCVCVFGHGTDVSLYKVFMFHC